MAGQVTWITGLSVGGKTTFAKELIQRLQECESQPILLDGDILRNLLQVSENALIVTAEKQELNSC